ncbi:stress responsive A/B barrel domain-containing protein [Metarhizium album ARSEF 1941]|uniref:Stress responsive A/B barrel domain-containing protein n=1 Tax=Metarhizium album (strain ARSEF 1941) TaxID=1081103 RepID=A0A0B2WJH4_METAS|nr:stress responsive A/B barrel domain-containing protein [Metarhizium album ARSEF 1941]KHN93829.1 stress responsive A/B barrel domain-containing protein [Metarhizium album ARSEF 1941]
MAQPQTPATATATATATPIHRVTLFKIASNDDQQRLLQLYQQMPTKALKHGKPYIRSVVAGPAEPDQRAQGFTFAAVSVFSSAADMAYYDGECAAHAELRAFARTVHSGAMVVFFENRL